ncbi:MAG: polyketide synthase [Myxococcota bacterium]
MSELKLLCRIPAEQTPIAEAIQAAGGVPVIDLTAAPDVEVVVPEGAWIRVRVGEPAPGAGPVILVGDDAQPLDGRPCWAEITRPQAVPAGFVGVILRGAAVGGPGSARPGMSLLRSMPSDTTVILEAALNPQAAQEAVSAGARGVLLADELLAQSALQAPPNIAARIERAGPGTDHQINGFRVQASPLSAGLRRLLGGEDPWSVTAGWWSADDPNNVPIPAGAGVVVGRTLAELYPTIDRLLAAYLSAMESVGTKDAAPATADASAVAGGTQPEAEDAVAIVGMGVRLPDAESVEAYWSNLVNGHSSIREVPRDRWEPELYWSEDRKAPDKTYTKIGGFIEGFTFHPRRFRIPPMMAKMLDPVQQLALESVGDALEDAGYGSDVDFDRTRVAVILGNSMGGEITDEYAVRTHYPMVQQALARVPAIAALPRATRDQLFKDFEEGVKAELPPINEDSMPGELPNVIAGRIANAFNLTGPNFTCDAACAGSMAAVQASVKGLLDHEFDMAVTGGSDRSMAVPTYVKFAKIGALSPDHSAPFDASANGFVMGEGCGVLVLKRLSDAVADGDRIYAVIRGVGGSSDGKGKGIMAPNPRGQRLALARAYASAGISPHEVDLIECHGTSTFVGDGVELKTISAFIGAGQRDATDPIRVGSVKSNIGHLKSAAGAASLIKTALSLYHKTLPPTLNYKTPREDVDLSTVPLKVQTTTEPWQTTRRRRAGVSAFGFGGINYHVVLEEHKVDDPRPVVQNGIGLPNGLWGVSADTAAQLVERLEMDKPPVYSRFAETPHKPLGRPMPFWTTGRGSSTLCSSRTTW